MAEDVPYGISGHESERAFVPDAGRPGGGFPAEIPLPLKRSLCQFFGGKGIFLPCLEIFSLFSSIADRFIAGLGLPKAPSEKIILMGL